MNIREGLITISGIGIIVIFGSIFFRQCDKYAHEVKTAKVTAPTPVTTPLGVECGKQIVAGRNCIVCRTLNGLAIDCD